MSRSNPCKKKRRQAKSTLLVFGEGLGEEMFLKHLKGIYSRDNGVAIAIRKGRGGSPKDIVKDALNVPGDYNRRIVILDNDKEEAEMQVARERAKKERIYLIENDPCLECLLITILDKKYTGKSSKWYKTQFESKYIEGRKRDNLESYRKVLPKKILEERRPNVPELELLISIIEGN